ncbi:hypothetical protein A4X13_0g556 [Tilletia indica]|uniref:Uncharacterized protein n=1 Tax=Tilletia indica TaxID=43049 RepID=A0A8T8THS7_9BASI|nr:hypothetical protein A4X13_0g556 [Tilletia indica]
MEVVTSLGLLEEVVVTILSWLKKKILDINALLIFYSAAPLAHHISSLAAAQSFATHHQTSRLCMNGPFLCAALDSCSLALHRLHPKCPSTPRLVRGYCHFSVWDEDCVVLVFVTFISFNYPIHLTRSSLIGSWLFVLRVWMIRRSAFLDS